MSPGANAAAEPDGLPVPRRWFAVLAIVLAIAMSVLDSSIANVALPSIARDLGASNAAAVWVVNAYQIAVLIALLPLAALGDYIGYRRVSQAGVALFTLASLGCTLAPTLTALALLRMVQGLGAAGAMSVSAALVRFTYPQRMLGRALGINAFVVATSAAVGPSLAGAILAVGHWRWLFAINLPIGIATLALALWALPNTPRGATAPRLSAVLLNAATFGLAIAGLQSLAHANTLPLAIAQLGAALLCGVLLVRRELGQPAPLVPFDLLRIRLFALSIATSVCSFAAQMAALVALPFEIERLGRTPAQTGALMTPWPLAVALAAPVAGRLADRYPAGLLGGIGLGALAAGLALLALFPEHGSGFELAWRIALCGLGFGLFQSPNNRTLLRLAPRARSGAAGGMLSTARLLGQSAGTAAVALLFRAYAQAGPGRALALASALAAIAALVSFSRLGDSAA